MAVDAVVAGAWAFGKIPVALHAAVGAVGVVAGLWSVALAAELHDVGVRDGLAVGFFERVVVVGVVAGHAG